MSQVEAGPEALNEGSFLREFFTPLGADPAAASRMVTAVWVRLGLIVPTIFVPTLLGLSRFRSLSYVPAAADRLFLVWSLLAGGYLLANLLIPLLSRERFFFLRMLTYFCLFAELATNQLMIYGYGTLTNYGALFALFGIVVYRVYFDYYLSLFGTAIASGMLALSAALEFAGVLPLSPLLDAPIEHLFYRDPSLGGLVVPVVAGGLTLAFFVTNYGMNQSLKLHRYITRDVLRRYLPEPLVERASRGQLMLNRPPERRTVTIMFCDLVGFTSLAERLGPDRTGTLLNDHLSHMSDLARKYGATIDKFIGDAIMVVFGAPIEQPARRQARNSVQLARALQASVPGVHDEYALPLRIGINTGEVVVGNFGTSFRSDYTVIGPAVNLAARLEPECDPGGILVSTSTARHLDEKDSLTPVGPLTLKGIEGEVDAFQVETEES